MSASFATIEAGLANLVKDKLGISDAAVLWANQNAPEPPTSIHAWVSLRRGDLTREGPVDGFEKYDTVDPDEGEEITLRAQGPRGLPFSIQAFSRTSANGDGSAYALLAQLQTAMSLPSTLYALKALGIGLNKVGPVRDLSGLVNQGQQGRALLELQLNIVDSAEERVGYFTNVNGDLILDPDGSPSVTIPFASGPTP